MDILRLPSQLRRALLQSPVFHTHLCRSISSSARALDAHATEPPIEANPSPSSTVSAFNSYEHTAAPNDAQLKYAQKFFHASAAQLLFASGTFRQLPATSFPEIALIGRSNVGKSTLVNALTRHGAAKLAFTGARAGVTQTINGYGVAGGLEYSTAKGDGAWRRFPRGGLVLLDMPGYGAKAREAWGVEALKTLQRRRQLRRVFVLLDAAHGVKTSDLLLLRHLHASGIPFSCVLTKVDKCVGSRASAAELSRLQLEDRWAKIRSVAASYREQINRGIAEASPVAAKRKRSLAGTKGGPVGDILCVSAEKPREVVAGLDALRWAILSACGMESDVLGRKKKLKGMNIVGEEGLIGDFERDASGVDVDASEQVDAGGLQSQYVPMSVEENESPTGHINRDSSRLATDTSKEVDPDVLRTPYTPLL